MIPSFFDVNDDMAVEEVLRQAGLELRGGRLEDVGAPTPPRVHAEPYEAEGHGDATPQEAQDGNLKKVVKFWKTKYNQLKEESADIEKTKRRLQDYDAMHRLDAYKLHRLCADLRERERAAVAQKEDAAKQLKEIKQVNHDLQEKINNFKKDKERSVVIKINEEEKQEEAARSAFNVSLQEENEKLRYDLSVRCKVLWQLGETQRLQEAQLEEKIDELAKARQREQQAIESRKDEERMVACLTREVESSGEEIDILRQGLKVRDEQIALLVAAVSERDASVEDLRREAEAREQRIHDLLAKASPPELSDLQEENENLRIQLSASRNAFQEARKSAAVAASDLAKHKTHLSSLHEAAADAQRKKLLSLEEDLTAEKHSHSQTLAELEKLRTQLQKLQSTTASEQLSECERQKEAAQQEVARLQREESRLKHYITTLGSRLDTVTGQLESANAKLRRQEAGAPPISPNRMSAMRSPFSRSVSPNGRFGRSPMHRGVGI